MYFLPRVDSGFFLMFILFITYLFGFSGSHLWHVGHLVPWQEIEPVPPALGARVLAVGPSGRSLDSDFVWPKAYIIWGARFKNSTNITNIDGTRVNIYLDFKMKSRHTRKKVKAQKCHKHHKIQKNNRTFVLTTWFSSVLLFLTSFGCIFPFLCLLMTVPREKIKKITQCYLAQLIGRFLKIIKSLEVYFGIASDW